MKNSLTKYEPLIIIECYDWTEYLVPEYKREKLETLMESNKFIKINDEVTEATLSIKRIKKAKYEVSLLEQMIANLPEHIKNKVRKKCEERKWIKETEGTIRNIIEHYTS